jgi:hypothetical protein
MKILPLVLVFLSSFFLSGCLYFQRPTETPESSSTADLIYVANQKSSKEVVVTRLKLSKPSFVVIQEVDSSGRPGGVIASTLLLDTKTQSTSVTLPAAPTVESQLFATIRRDNGDKQFQADVDPIVVDSESGEMAAILFKIE